MEKREIWVDDVKVIACMLVLLGHLMQSMTASSIVQANSMYEWFNKTIYYFHVPLFFICSGYLYQKLSTVSNLESLGINALKKALTLGVPYFTFTIATWLIKTAFSGAGNNEIDNIFTTLFLQPTSPYWYLYILFFVFLITPTFSSKRNAIIGMVVAMGMKVVYITETVSKIAGGGIRMQYQEHYQTRYGSSSECSCVCLKLERFNSRKPQLVLALA
ncbi:MAG: acyltransferase family protein [Bacteroides thetaiotaomicron]|nr:acyltransferase family protein [Bacteroides thetaiotaomicron]